MSESNAAASPPSERCGCPNSGWFNEGPPCDLAKGHRGDHGCPSQRPLFPDHRMSWAQKDAHPIPCGCRLCSPGKPPDMVAVARVLEKAGPGAKVDELIRGGFCVTVPFRRADGVRSSAVRILVAAGTIPMLEAGLADAKR